MNRSELQFDDELWCEIMQAIYNSTSESQGYSSIDLAIDGHLFLENL